MEYLGLIADLFLLAVFAFMLIRSRRRMKRIEEKQKIIERLASNKGEQGN